MIDALLGKKIGMTSVYDEEGNLLPVTVLQLGPCEVVQVKTDETDGYTALQLGFDDRKPKNVSQPVQGHYKKAGVKTKRFLREVGWDGEGDVKPGSVLTVEEFAEQPKVDVTGITKGRGFQGVVRRYGFAGGPKTHGQGDRHRAPGSIGQSAYPSRVLKGTRMAGRMGGARRTTRNLQVVRVDVERNALLVKGAVPGPRTGYVIVRRAGR
jgi:large subunit ribosomal protein L3